MTARSTSGLPKNIDPACRINFIKAHGAHDVPGRHLPAVIVAAEAVGLVGVKFRHDLADAHLGLGRLAHIVVKIGDMVTLFIALRALTDQAGNIDNAVVNL